MAGGGRHPEGDRHPPIQRAIRAAIALAIVVIARRFSVRFEHQPNTARDVPPRPATRG